MSQISDIVILLEETLPKNLYALDFTTEQYKTFLQKLKVSDNEALFNDKKTAIQKAIITYFAKSHQQIELQVTFESFALKKHLYDPSKPEAYDRMLQENSAILIDISERKSDFSPLPYLITIPEEIRIPILENFLRFENDINTVRQTIRRQIDQVFDLDPRDIIFFLRGRITIRIHTPPRKFAEGVDKRFGGESVEDMEAMYAAYFPEGAWEHIEPILGEVITEKLNFGVIDNFTFNRTFIPVFRSMIEILLLEIIKPEDRNKIEGFTGFVLRQYFHKILIATAKNLLQFVEDRDKNAEAFIKYFADEIIVDSNGNKIQKYAIIDSKQQKWNFSAIISVIMQYKQVKLKIASQKEMILSAEHDMNECQNDLDAEKNNKESTAEQLTEIQVKLTETDAAILHLKSQPAETAEEKVLLKSQINKLNYQQTEHYDLKKKINNQVELSKNKIANKIAELTRREKKVDYEKKVLQTFVEQMTTIVDTYETVVEALATVLTKR